MINLKCNEFVTVPDLMIKKDTIVAVMLVREEAGLKMRINYVTGGVFHSSEVATDEKKFHDFCKLVRG